MNQIPTTDALKSLKTITLIVYILHALSFLLGITSIAAVIVNYVKRSEVKGTWLESHFRWQIRTFWYSLLWGLIGAITLVLIIGYLIWFLTVVWYIYRIARGWLHLNDGKEMYVK